MVAEAQRSRAPIQGLADKVAGIFVPVVLAVAVLTFVSGCGSGRSRKLAHAIVNAVAVLIIACPCALGLATPMSIMVGVGRGAQAGVLVKNAEALERLEKVDTLVVDKTGTLTEGKPKLIDVIAGARASTRRNCCVSPPHWSSSSEHPLAAAIVQGAKEQVADHPRTGEGLPVRHGGRRVGNIAGRAVVIGKPEFLRNWDQRLGVHWRPRPVSFRKKARPRCSSLLTESRRECSPSPTHQVHHAEAIRRTARTRA
jgi:Cu+-exporting ATPase